jgi:hypothetical protein
VRSWWSRHSPLAGQGQLVLHHHAGDRRGVAVARADQGLAALAHRHTDDVAAVAASKAAMATKSKSHTPRAPSMAAA